MFVRFASALVIFLCFGLSRSGAALVSHDGSSAAMGWLQVNGTLGGGFLNLASSASPGTVFTTIDTTSLELSYTSLSLNTGGATTTLTREITTGFGETSIVAATVSFSPISLSLNNLGTVALIPSTGGNFTTETRSVPNTTITVSGSYEITDGTTTFTGTFDVPANVGLDITDTVLNSSQFPDGIQLGRSGVSPVRGGARDLTFFSERFGTTDVTIGASRLSLQTGNFVSLGNFNPIPEPSSALYLAIGSLTVFLRRK